MLNHKWKNVKTSFQSFCHNFRFFCLCSDKINLKSYFSLTQRHTHIILLNTFTHTNILSLSLSFSFLSRLWDVIFFLSCMLQLVSPVHILLKKFQTRELVEFQHRVVGVVGVVHVVHVVAFKGSQSSILFNIIDDFDSKKSSEVSCFIPLS